MTSRRIIEIIKETINRGAIVIMDSEKYINTTLILLQDNTYYAKINNYSQSKIMAKLTTLVHRFQRGLMEKERDYFSRFDSKTSNFYELPKTHKSEAGSKSTSLIINILRPVVTDTQTQ